MKKYVFNIGQSAIELFFPQNRIKTKLQMIEILLETTRYMLVKPFIDKKNIGGKVILYIDKMSRLFFIKNKKYYSIVFPFSVNDFEGKINFTFQNDIEVNNTLISNVLSVIKCDKFKEKCSLDFAEPIFNYESEFDDNFWIFIRELLLVEDGYLRYDNDEDGYRAAKEKGEELKHPLNHYDIFYSNKATFKIGLDCELIEKDFIDLLNINTNSKYLKTF